jgi:signal transduction histidine kinase
MCARASRVYSAQVIAHALTWVRRAAVAHPVVVDALLGGAVTLLTLICTVAVRAAGSPRASAAELGLAALTALPTVLRRRAPLAVLIACCAFACLYIPLGSYPAEVYFGGELAWYTVAASYPPRRAAPGAAAMLGMTVYALSTAKVLSGAALVVSAAIVVGVLWWLGEAARQLAARNARLAELSAELRREQQAHEQRALNEQRIRIARELHDVVAHHMAVVAVQAGLAHYVMESEPGRARNALTIVMDATEEALQETRRVLALLRLGDEQPEGEPSGLARLPELAERIRLAGVPLEVAVRGEPRPLPSGVDRCAYRVIQESLTNVLKHAPGAVTSLDLRYEQGRLFVQVTNDAAAARAVAGGSGGYGLNGMRERAALYGGTLTAGSRLDGGFTVALAIPAPAGTGANTRPGDMRDQGSGGG